MSGPYHGRTVRDVTDADIRRRSAPMDEGRSVRHFWGVQWLKHRKGRLKGRLCVVLLGRGVLCFLSRKGP